MIKKGAIMVANQTAMTASTGYTTDWCIDNARKLSLWKRLLFAFQIALAKKPTVRKKKFGRNYSYSIMARKETERFDPYTSAVKYDIIRLI